MDHEFSEAETKKYKKYIDELVDETDEFFFRYLDCLYRNINNKHLESDIYFQYRREGEIYHIKSGNLHWTFEPKEIDRFVLYIEKRFLRDKYKSMDEWYKERSQWFIEDNQNWT